MNILQQVIHSQSNIISDTACTDITYNGNTVKALVGDSSHQREQAVLGSEDYDSCRISVFKTAIPNVNLKSDEVIISGITYKPIRYDDGESTWDIELTAKTIVERSRENYRK